MPTIDASTSPELATQIINSVLSNSSLTEEADKYYVENGSAEVRELTGRDEEAIAKSVSLANTLQLVLQRGVVKIGNAPATETVLDNLLAGDRDWLLLNIYAASFGKDIDFTPYCPVCAERVAVTKSLFDVVPVKKLSATDSREFSVTLSKGTATATLPNGRTQKELLTAAEKTNAELSTILLKNCVTSLNGIPILRDAQLLDLSVRDRRILTEAIMAHAIGPQLQEVKIDCPTCSTELEVPLSLAALFQFS